MTDSRRVPPAHATVERSSTGGATGVERKHDDGRSARSHVLAWTVSLALHAALLTAGLLLFHRLTPPQPENPERLVYVEPAPPPPPLAAGGEGEIATSDAA